MATELDRGRSILHTYMYHTRNQWLRDLPPNLDSNDWGIHFNLLTTFQSEKNVTLRVSTESKLEVLITGFGICTKGGSCQFGGVSTRTLERKSDTYQENEQFWQNEIPKSVVQRYREDVKSRGLLIFCINSSKNRAKRRMLLMTNLTWKWKYKMLEGILRNVEKNHGQRCWCA